MKLLEVCVDSFASARAAKRGGADRLEFCSALAVGGLTPYADLLRQIKAEMNLPAGRGLSVYKRRDRPALPPNQNAACSGGRRFCHRRFNVGGRLGSARHAHTVGRL